MLAARVRSLVSLLIALTSLAWMAVPATAQDPWTIEPASMSASVAEPEGGIAEVAQIAVEAANGIGVRHHNGEFFWEQVDLAVVCKELLTTLQ